jgi:hypothetical protein
MQLETTGSRPQDQASCLLSKHSSDIRLTVQR